MDHVLKAAVSFNESFSMLATSRTNLLIEKSFACQKKKKFLTLRTSKQEEWAWKL